MTGVTRERRIYRVTLAGSFVNIILLIFKFVAGIVGHSAAMIADAVHSLSDFLTDVVVIVFVHLSNKPEDEDHDYGHGKYETLATSLIGLALFAVGVMIAYGGVVKINWDLLLPHSSEKPASHQYPQLFYGHARSHTAHYRQSDRAKLKSWIIP